LNPDSHSSPDAASQLRHDLRTPVNHIIGYSEMLLEDAEECGNESSASDLKKIRSAAHELLGLINTRLSVGGLQELPRPSNAATWKGGDSKRSEKLFYGKVLAVDDNRENLDVLARRLARHGLDVETAESGLVALAAIRSQAFDLVLLDVMMPGVDGYTVLRELKSDPETRDIPVIMISALDELDSVTRCIEAGAEDYLPKPFDPTLLEARIGACLEKKALRDAEQGHLRKIEETQNRLDKELAEAAAYVRSILPLPADSPLPVNWKYRPSSELAGDSFGYHWIDSEHFAVYLLDVCGHGVGACLLSVAAGNVLRSGSLHDVDFRNPGEVLTALNNAFPMEKQNNLYFTIWYGVYHAPSRTLSFASGGHPPALLLEPTTSGAFQSHRLSSNGMIIGVMEDTPFSTQRCVMPPGARLYVLCDGCYEIRSSSGEMADYAAFETFMTVHADSPDPLGDLENWAIAQRGESTLEDDFSIMQIQFPA
jgi:sigma-B regulation protein RsbU (phosphoserine phosphatase)